MTKTPKCQAKNPSACIDPMCPEKRGQAAKLAAATNFNDYVKVREQQNKKQGFNKLIGWYKNMGETKKYSAMKMKDFADRMRDSSQSVEFHFITDEEESDFTEADCAFLARAIHEKTGWTMVIVSSDKSKSLSEIEWYHMAVRTPDGRLIDAVGMSTEADFRNAWGGVKAELTEVPDDQWETVQSWGRQSKSSPVKIANRILKSLRNLDLYEGSKALN